MAIVAAVTATDSVMRILKHAGLPYEVPTFHAARPPPQPELTFDVSPPFEADPPAPENWDTRPHADRPAFRRGDGGGMRSPTVLPVLHPWLRLDGGVFLCVFHLRDEGAVQAPARPGRVSGASFLIGGGALYVVGTFLVTMLFNVPRNNALAALNATTPEAAALWTNYLSTWTSWNHVRTLAALVATFLFALALRARS
jgi:hypothetical protein